MTLPAARRIRLSDAEVARFHGQRPLIPDYRLPEAWLERMRAVVDRLIALNPDMRPEALSGAHNPWGQSARTIGTQTFLDLCRFDEILDMVEQLIGPDIALWGSQLFCKHAGDGQAVPWHQDGQYWPLDPTATVTVRIAFAGSTPENGCMRWIPGSHKSRKSAMAPVDQPRRRPVMKTLLRTLPPLLLALGSVAAAAQAFPERPLAMVVPFGAGGSTDLIARALAAEMGKSLGQQVVVINKAGAAGTIGAMEVANARADGHTLGMLPVGPLTTQPNLRKLSYSPASFEPVCRVYSNPQVVLVHKSSPFKTVADFVADARAHPGKLNYASPGAGSVPHLAMQALSKAAGIDMVHVPYKGEADALQALIGGHVSAFVAHPTFLAAHAQTLRAMAVMAPSRLKEYPDLPTLLEVGGPPLHFEVWGGLVATKGTPAPVLAALERACAQGTAAEAFRKQLETLNTPVLYQDSKAFGAFVASEFERNGRLLREAGIRPE